ncbi:centrosomal protein of 85 kDa-like isoform X3 [Leucoraja erinacea]|uniref:centrosomal protein of 85 kDa-like isoform X3 n=1 Tax=Leucoraja erinaceus TaxID=7782 RepID=UPI002455895D|nr:centrosomal protein of 85 kDa-like isoform X3 [Leucoraja erinacea]
MWGRDISDHKNGFTICRRQAGPDVPHAGWVPGCEAGWPVSTSLTSGQNITSRRFSAASDSGDTGIGTSSSDSIEEHSSGISSFKPIRSHIAIPTAHVMPSTSNPSLTRPGKQDRSTCSKGNLSQTLPGKPKNIFILNPSLDMKDPRPIRKWSSLSKLSGPGNESPDGDVSGNGNFVSSMVTVSNCNAKLCTYAGNVTENCIHPNTEYLKSQDTKSWNTSTKESPQNQYPLSDGQYKFECLYNAAGDSSLSESTSSKKHSDLAFSAFSATKATKDARETCGPRHGFTSLEHQPAFGTTAPTSLRTQLWLSDQMLASTLGLRPAERSCAITGCQLKQRQQQPWQEADQMQMHNKPPLQVSMVFPTQLDQDPSQKDAQLQIKESLLRKKDIIIESQEQQIFQLQRKIQENELRAQRAFLEQCEPTLMLKTQHQPSCENIRHTRFTEISKVLDWGKKDLLQRLSAAELEILHLKETLKKNTQKYMDETKKIEEKMKAREKYISSLKKKLQKESEQSYERQQRIETLENYLADLPTLDDFQIQSQQLTTLEEKNEQFQNAFKDFEKKLGEKRVLCREKEVLLENLKKREKELVATVQSLQQKVEKCLEDGVRLPMLDVKQLQIENDYLREKCEHASKVIDNHEQQLEKYNLEKQALEERLTEEKFASQMFRKELGETQRNLQLLKGLMEDFSTRNQRVAEANSILEERSPETERPRHLSVEETTAIQNLLKEMSICLHDLRALCNILTERAQGKEPNLSLLLGIQSLQCSGDEVENYHSDEFLSKKLTDVYQLRKDIDELRTIISDRYAQDMGDNCITQ